MDSCYYSFIFVSHPTGQQSSLNDNALEWMAALLPGAVAAMAALGAAWLLLRPNGLIQLLDRPGPRSLHDVAKPRTGGLAIWLGVTAGWLAAWALGWSVADNPYLIGGWALIAAVSLADDLGGLPALPRFVVHFLAAAMLIPAGYGLREMQVPGGWTLALGAAEIPLTLLLVTWLANLYNFMDGMDGFAGGMGAIGFGWLALLAGLQGHEALAHTATLIALANLGFLAFNFPPARIFMGDAGAVPMGFAAGGLSLWGISAGAFPFWIPVMIFSPFIADATVTLLLRLSRGEKVWEAHRSHYYQRLVLLGWGHRKTVLAEYGVMAAAGATAYVLSLWGNSRLELAALAGWFAFYGTAALVIRRTEQKKSGKIR